MSAPAVTGPAVTGPAVTGPAVTGPAVTGPAVTVVVPAYQAARYLRAAVGSALAQTHAALEVVIADDGSTDDTLAVARAIDDPRVTVVAGPHRGLAGARNAAAAAARPAPLVALLDADDLWDADKLATQLAWLDAHPGAVAVGSFMRYVSSRGAVLGETGQTIDDAALAEIARGELMPFPMSSCLVVRRDALDAVGGFDDTLRCAEDIDFLARLARLGAVGCVPRVLGSYRVHPESMMARRRAEVNAHARFVRARIRARDAGGDLTWDAYRAAHPPTWRERRRDLVETWYRAAALWHGERRPLRAFGYGALAAAAAPTYTLRRLLRQRLRLGA